MPLTINTYAWFIKHVDEIKPDVYGVIVCDEAHTALGEKTAAAIRRFNEPIYIGMTATDQLLAKHVGDVFPAEVADFPLAEAVRRGVVAPLRCIRVRPDRLAAQGRDRRRRLRPGPAGRRARPRPVQPGRRRPLPEPLRRHARDRLRRRRRARRAGGAWRCGRSA